MIQSGTPISQFLAHPAYDNAGEIPLGGRGSLGRTDWTFPIDAHADYTVKVSEKVGTAIRGRHVQRVQPETALYVDQWLELSGGVTESGLPEAGSEHLLEPVANAPVYARCGAD